MAIVDDFACCNWLQAECDTSQRRFSRARLSNQRNRHATLDRQVNAVDRLHHVGSEEGASLDSEISAETAELQERLNVSLRDLAHDALFAAGWLSVWESSP